VSPEGEAQGLERKEFQCRYILPWTSKNDHTVMHIKKRLIVPRIELNGTAVLFLERSRKITKRLSSRLAMALAMAMAWVVARAVARAMARAVARAVARVVSVARA
jgi:hypothetical protein